MTLPRRVLSTFDGAGRVTVERLMVLQAESGPAGLPQETLRYRHKAQAHERVGEHVWAERVAVER